MPRRSTAREEFKTRHNVFDDFTNRTVYKLITEGHFEGLESPLFIGKESNVFIARKKDDTPIIVKIYRLETCDFNRMYDYIKGDPRYLNLKKRRRNVIFTWVQREYRNLFLAREANVPVPTPYAFMNNVLVMECIMDGNMVAPKLKDAKPPRKEECLNKVIANMKRLWRAGLVHADLSPFNILSKDGSPVFIDFSQACSTEHGRSEEFLDRDIRNIATYFRNIGLDVSESEMKRTITATQKNAKNKNKKYTTN